jgi:uncharacterized protein (TIGR02271 family)
MKSNFLGDRAQAAIFRAPDGDLVEQEQVPRLLARCESRDEALRLICDLAEETVPGAVAGVTIAQGNGSHIATGVFPSLPQSFSDALRLLVIPVVEEELRVGKRDVQQGGVKVKSHVVETPVTEQVNLRQERVSVERRPVDRPLSGNERAFQDRTIEVEQRGEEAIVSKEARVKEEVVVKKDVEQRTERVSDTVRRTEVEVENERPRQKGSGSSRTSQR